MAGPVHRMTITHNNGRQQIITARRYRADGLWIIFEDADKQEILRLNEHDVRSIRQEAA